VSAHSRSERSQRTRDAHRNAGLARFRDQGVAATSVEEIAADAGVTKRTFYRHYDSKLQILFSDYDARMNWFRKALEVRPRNEPLTRSVRAAVDAFPYDDALSAVADMRNRELDDEYVRTQLRRLQAELAHEIERHVQQRNPAQGDAAFVIALRAQWISAAMFTAIETWMRAGDHHNVEELSRLVDLALSVLDIHDNEIQADRRSHSATAAQPMRQLLR
jgi:AcrR family transcriptional regulator